MRALSVLTTVAFLGAPGVVMAQTSNQPTIVLTGEEAPTSQAWTQPASLSYVDSSDDGEDRTQFNAALK
ncbi:hypothetical protein, partial [Brevundimonas sp.]|uniref:hypothetical protein n=1 Tax=Brevundimonas sp. TaxID=1871086 RepID=UPI00391EF000